MGATHARKDHEDALRALRASVDRLHQLCRGLDDVQLRWSSYCTGWSIADVLSHLGSSAVLLLQRIDDPSSGVAPDRLAVTVREAWRRKSARAAADDALVEDEALLERLERLERLEHVDGRGQAGPPRPPGAQAVSLGQVVAGRLREHVLHTWDIEVAFDEEARLPEEAVAVIVDDLAATVRDTSRPVGAERRFAVRTVHPARGLVLRLGPRGAELDPRADGAEPDLELPAEAFCRLVYGRLDEDHSPTVRGAPGILDLLRQVLPGP